MIVIYGQDYCVFCDKSKALCEQMGLEYNYIDIKDRIARESFKQHFPGATTVPQIIMDGEHIGGYRELWKLLSDRQSNET